MPESFTYFDHNATTPIDERVLEKMMNSFKNSFANASSSHYLGQKAKKDLTKAREKVAELLSATPQEIFFTSGATESINLAIKGLALNPNNIKKHIVTCQTEHKAVLETCRYLETIGFEVDYVPVDSNGSIDLEILKSIIRIDTLLVCLMWVNNETGIIHPVEEIGLITRDRDVYFVCDGTQAVGKISIDVKKLEIDIICFSAHKMYGPKGIGALYLNSERLKNRSLLPVIHGGGQENGLRSGTSNVPQIVGFGEACSIAKTDMYENQSKIYMLKEHLELQLQKIEGHHIYCDTVPRIFNTTNVYIPLFDVDIFIGLHSDIAISSGSACVAALIQPSHTLLAMGVSREQAMSSLRISLGKNNTTEDIHYLVQSISVFSKSYQ